uniref:Protein rolling stone n=1 Tax=Clastoptera arizonana TaxID=38151 RepID=A0A1B6C3D6_9HEMI
MVLDLWKTKLHPILMKKEQQSPHVFLKCQWQKKEEISKCYIIYRWLLASIFSSTMIASLLGLGKPFQGNEYYLKWFIYLTHWGFSIATIQAILAAVLITRIYLKQKRKLDLKEETLKMKTSFKVYWILHTVSVVAAFSISILYWSFVYDPSIHTLDVINVMIHAFNSVLMLIDLCLVSHPIRLSHLHWPLGFALCYTVFSAVYFAAGGTDRLNRTYIYNIMDWRKPWRTLLIVVGLLTFVVVLHTLVLLFSLFRIYLFSRFLKHNSGIKTNDCETTDQPVSVINVV